MTRSSAVARWPRRVLVWLSALFFCLLTLPRLPGLVAESEAAGAGSSVTPAYYSCLIVVGVAVCVLSVSQFRDWGSARLPTALVCLLLFAFLSCLWSVNPAASFVYVVQMAVVFGVVGLSAAVLGPHGVVRSLAICGVLLLLTSTVYIVGFPDLGTSSVWGDVRWRGVFGNENTLGRWVVLTSVLICGGMIARGWYVGAISGVALTSFVLFRINSLQALIVFVLLLVLFLLLFVLSRTVSRSTIGVVVCCAFAAVISIVAFFLDSRLVDSLVIEFSNRDGLWGSLLPVIGEAPLLGFGVGAFWGSSEAASVVRVAGFEAAQAHNSYIDAALSAGIPFALFFVAFVFWQLVLSARIAIAVSAYWVVPVIWLFVSAYSFTASLLFAGSFEWWALVVGLAVAQRSWVKFDTFEGVKLRVS